MTLSWSCKWCGETFYLEDYRNYPHELIEDMQYHAKNCELRDIHKFMRPKMKRILKKLDEREGNKK